nr:hypothetical protein [Streptomyces cavernae]
MRVTGLAGLAGLAGRIAVLGALLGLGALWWWSVARLVLSPDAGALEGAVAVGGWGLSLVPVHCAPKTRAPGAVGVDRWVRAWHGGASGVADRVVAEGHAGVEVRAGSDRPPEPPRPQIEPGSEGSRSR